MPPSAGAVLRKSLVGSPWLPEGGGHPPCSMLPLHGTGVGTIHSRVGTPLPPG